MNIILLAACWALYLALHSILASGKTKRWVEVNIPQFYSRYRLIYSIIAIITFIPLILLMLWTSSQVLFPSGRLAKFIGLVFATWGILIFKSAFKGYSLKAFIGITDKKEKLYRSGIQRFIRHPLYTGTIMICLGLICYSPTLSNLVSIITIFIYLPFGIYFEEKKLLKQYGDDYMAYKRTVPSLFPNISNVIKSL